MEIFNPNANIPFMRWRKLSMTVSCVLMALAVVLLISRGLNFALDFTGGTLVEARFAQPVPTADVRAALEKGGFSEFTVQSIGSGEEVAMRLPPEAADMIAQKQAEEGGEPVEVEANATAEHVKSALAAAGLQATIKRSEFVGPQVGKELAEDGVVAVVFVIITIMIYVALRFEWRFGVSAIAGEVHDTLLTVGFIAAVGMDFDLTVLAGVLTVVGYSINDKVVVFDRVREIFRSARKLSAEDSINKAINNTLSRTLITGVTTIMALSTLYFLGGPVLEGFAATVLFGVIVGTLSSIFFCNPILLWMGVSKQDLIKVTKDDPELALRP